MDELFQRLAAPFPPEQVSWRVGTSNKKKQQRENGPNAKATKGQVLAYLDARDVMDRLDEVCGPAGWMNRYTSTDKKTVCEIGIKVGDEWVWKADGAGESDIEAEKGALSDAFKRAAVRWGIGRYLYHLPTPWVDLDDREQIPDPERRKLEGLLRRDAQANTPTNRTPVEERGIYVACAAAIDLCETKTDLDLWFKNNEVSMNRIKAEDPEVHQAVRARYAKRLREVTPAEKVAA